MNLPRLVLPVGMLLVAVVLIGEPVASTQGHKTPPRTSTSKPAATSLVGQYSIVGTNPDGGTYKGNLEVIARGDVYQFRWAAGSQSDGIGVRNGSVVAVAFASGRDGTGCGVVDYKVLDDGSLDGIWGYWGANGSGTEKAKRVSGRGLEGEYAATGTNPDGGRYQANISVQALGGGYKFVWSNNSEGFGVYRGNHISVGIGGERCGFVTYEVGSDGVLDGVWGGYGSQQTGTEKATKR